MTSRTCTNSIGLIIGGCSWFGKTTIAKCLCDRLDLALIQSDRILPNNPTLNPLAGTLQIWDRPPRELCQLLIEAADAAIPYLAHEVEALTQSQAGWIMEGERVHPELVKRLQLAGCARGIFIVETDFQRLHDTLLKRLPGFRDLLESRQRAVAELDRLYNLWLVSETARLRIPWVASQPWETLAGRISKVLDEVSIKDCLADEAVNEGKEPVRAEYLFNA